MALPGAFIEIVNGVIEQLLETPEQLEELLAGLVALLITLPAMLTDLLTGLLTQLENITGVNLTQFLPLWTGLDFSSPVAFFASLATALVATGTALLGPNSPLNALNLFNLVPTDLMAQVDASHIGTAITNLINDPFFLDFPGMGEWFSDPTGGFDGLGAAVVIADGTTHELLGNLIPVSESQVLPLSGMASWAGLAGSGLPIALGVIGYITGSDSTVESIIASHGVSPPSTDWLTLGGSYTIPANVSSLRTRLIVGSGATGGIVKFSNMSATKTQSLLQKLIAGTDPGTFLNNDIENLFGGIVSNAIELTNKAGLSDFNGLVSTIAGDVQEGFEDVSDRLESFLDSLSPLNGSNINTGNIADHFVPGISSIIDTSVQSISNIAGSAFDYPDLGSSFAAQTHALTDAGTQITNLVSKFLSLESKVNSLPTPTGPTTPGSGTAYGGATPINDTDDFERTSSSGLGALWSTSYSGGAGTWATPNGHDASFINSGVADRDFLSIRNNSAIPRSATDYQRVTMVVSAKATRYYDLLLGTFNYTGHNDVWLRVSDSSTSLSNVTGTRIRFGGDGGMSIVRFLSGSPTTLASLAPGSITAPGPGAQIIGEAGSLENGVLRYFRGIIGVSTRIQITEVGTASGAGAAHRRWGHGGRAEGHLLPLPGQQKPGSLHYWNGTDQTSGLT